MPSSDNTPSARLAGQYDAEARAYQTCWAPVLKEASCALMEGIPGGTAGCVLDIGTGAGSLLLALAGRFPRARVVGADRSTGMLALSPPDSLVVAGDAMALPFPDGVFDVAEIAAGLAVATLIYAAISLGCAFGDLVVAVGVVEGPVVKRADIVTGGVFDHL